MCGNTDSKRGERGLMLMRVSSKLSAILAGAGFALLLPAAAAQAGGDLCTGKWCYDDAPAPVIHRTFKRRVEIERGAYEIAREPALYGWVKQRVVIDEGEPGGKPVYGYVKKRVLLRQYKNIAIYHRARHKYVRERVVIEPETYASDSIFGDWWLR